ncbi:Fe-S cluster assembly protein SufD [soil metagenome]
MATAVEERTKGFTREAVEELARRRNEPDWLRTRRLAAWEAYMAIPMPVRTDEEWRRTDIRDLPLEAVMPYTPEFSSRVSSRDELPANVQNILSGARDLSGLVVQEDSSIIYHEAMAELADQGVIFVDFDTAIAEHADLLEQYLMSSSTVPINHNKFAALHSAFWTTGAFLYVPDDVEVELPFEAISTVTRPGLATAFHTLVVAGENARVTFVDYCVSETLSEDIDDESISNNVVELHAAAGAEIRYIQIQNWGRHIWNFNTQRGNVAQDGAIRSLNVSLGAGWSKNSIATTMSEAGAQAEMLGLFFTDGDQFLDNHTHQDHDAPYAMSDLLFKGAVKDRSRAVYSGLIRVAEKAFGTDAYQANRNLSLSPNARVDTMPNLEIGANDVRCTHGATVSRIEDEYLFYLMSRGINRTEAEKLMIDGFFAEVIDRVPIPQVQEIVQDVIDQKIGYTV